MANTNYRIELSDGHGSGASQDFQPLVLGQFEMQCSYASGVALSPGDVIISTGAADPLDVNTRAIVTSADGITLTARIVPSTAAWAASANAEAAYSNANPKGGWIADGGLGVLSGAFSRVSADGSLTPFVVSNIRFWDDAANFTLKDERLTRVVGSNANPVYYDKYAKRAVRLEVDGTTPIFPGQIIRNAGNTWSATVIAGYTGSPDIVYVGRVIGTLTTGQTITVDSGAATDRTITSIGATPAFGEWVPYSATPMLGETTADELTTGAVGGAWETPPRGNWIGKSAGLGPDAELVHLGDRYHAREVVAADQNYRHFKRSSRETVTTQYRALGGIMLQIVKVTLGAETPFLTRIGTTVSSGSWSATVVTTGADATDGWLVVAKTNGEVLASGGTLTSGAVTATAQSTCIGWRKGSLHYEESLAELQAAQADTNGLSDGDAAELHSVFLMVWEGEISVAAKVAAGGAGPITGLTLWTIGGGSLYANYLADLTSFMDEIRNDARMQTAGISTQTDIALWSHLHGLEGSQASVTLNGIPWSSVVFAVRDLWAIGANATESHIRSSGLEMASGTDLWLRPLDYVELGALAWRGMTTPHVALPDSPFEPLPIVILVGQSQLYGFNSATFLANDSDREAYMSSSFPGGLDTTRDSVMQWNHKNGRIEKFDLAVGTNSAWSGVDGLWGPDATLIARMRERFGKLLQFKLAIGGTCLSPNVSEATACWSKAGSIAGRASVTLSDLTFVDNGNGTVTITTATADGFEDLIGTTNGKLGTVDEDGNRTICRLQLTSTNASYNQDRFTSYQIPLVDYSTTSITVNASDLPAGTPGVAITLTIGPPFVWPYLVEQWQAMCHQMVNIGDGDLGGAALVRYIPHPVLVGFEQGESDFAKYTEYAVLFAQFWTDLLGLVSLRVDKIDVGLPKFISQTHKGTPLGSDAALAAIRAAHAAQAAAMPDCALIDTSDLALESDGVTAYVSKRQENGVHHTPRAQITKGYLWDQAVDGLTGIPPHPTGDNVADFGAANSGTFTSNPAADAESGGEEDGGESSAPVSAPESPGSAGSDGLIVEDGNGYSNADSLASVATADEIIESYGTPAAWTAATETEKAQALRRATRDWFEGLFGNTLRGIIQHKEQRLSVPRTGLFDDAGRYVPTSTVPWQFVHAVVIVSADTVAGGVILPTGFERGEVLRETKKGIGFEKTLEYAGGSNSGSASVKRQRAADALIYPFVAESSQGVSRS